MSEQSLLGSHADDAVAIAKAAGFEISVEEVAKTLEELSDEQLIAVAGGWSKAAPYNPYDPSINPRSQATTGK